MVEQDVISKKRHVRNIQEEHNSFSVVFFDCGIVLLLVNNTFG
jgi:hypothetical protein